MTRPHQGDPPAQTPPPGAREDLRHGRRARASRCSAPTAASPRSWSTTSAARTLAAVNWFEPELRSLSKAERAKRAGELLAERAKAAGISEAVFDRGGYRYHGHVRTFAEAIREAGITV